MICRDCKRENPEGDAFCGGCGGRLVAVCDRCGETSPPGNAFCGKCGHRLAPQEPPAEEDDDGERRQLTVLFCDLVGSTDLSARLDPEEYREGLRAYHARADEVLQRYGGYVAQHLGDGLLVYFGWPQAHDDAAERAVRAGLEMAAATASVEVGGGALCSRIGIHTGTVVVSQVGTRERHETLAVGETLNLAARVQGAAEPGEVMITAATQRLIAGLFVVEEHRARQLKGIPAPVDLYRVVQSSGARGRFAAAAARGFSPFVGRGEERALLRSRFARAAEGEGQVVLLIGEAGIGKSRLAQVLREDLAERPHTWLETACSPHFSGTPFHPVTELLNDRRPWERAGAARLQGLARSLRRA